MTLANRQGRSTLVAEDQPILDAFEQLGVLLPVACRYGGCVTCAARLLEGEIAQPRAKALKQRQIDAGYVLLCIAEPRSDCVLEVGVESQDALFENPFRRARKPDSP
ncbi:MAG: 2Fe-2S iron-sulfur cluster binding domain-containing protein [Myxococcales bacterium]|nr:2Fe-2S iron-sulfur cluster binding domain-containing protein [Myxococcales bacterium]MCA9698276.1 2Fe-2S iron-sulfur cluster binding domain-containing protein [Myxococcales bacterium]